MPLYSYRATTYEGTVQEGFVDAPDEHAAVEAVRELGFIPLKIIRPEEKRFTFKIPKRRPDLLTFTEELSALLKAGLPLDRALHILSEITEQKEMAETSRLILQSIKEGDSFSEALSKHPRIFPRLYVSMVRAGEAGGVLDVVLEKLVEFLESTKQLKESVISATIYPAILTFTGGVSIVILLTYVIPKFSQIFTDIGQPLPLITELLIHFSNTINRLWWVVLTVLVLGGIFLKRYISTSEGRRRWDTLKIKLLRELVLKLETARFCRTLGALLKGGVPLLQALQNVKEVVGNTVIASSLEGVISGVREGGSMAVMLQRTALFPELAISMIRVGEETGRLDEMLLRVADTYEKSLQKALKRFISLLEPSLILMMGLIVGFIVISILVAIFSINEIPF